MATWQGLDEVELAEAAIGYVRGQTTETISVEEVGNWIKAHMGEVEAYLLSPSAIAHRFLAVTLGEDD